MKNQKGFSLIELLVVVIIIGIIAAIAIPSLLASRRAATEAAAVSAMRTIMSANATYQATVGGGVNYAGLGDLNAAGGLIDATLGSGTKGGYGFALDAAGAVDGTPAPQFCVVATPVDTSLRTYAMGYDGVIKVNTGNVATGAAPTCDGTTLLAVGDVLGN